MINLKELRKKKPKFLRQEYHKRKRLQKVKWRRPKGFHSKLRVYHKSKGKRVLVGYRSPSKVRGLHVSSKEIIQISNLTELKSLKKDKQMAIISRTLGTKKKLALLREAKKLGIDLVNIKDIDAYITRAEKRIGKKKEARKARAEKRKKKKSKKEKKKEKPEEEKKPEVKEEKKETKLGFYEKVVPQVFEGKTKTYRLRDHNLKVGDKLDFENSQTGEIFGSGVITKIERKKISDIDLKDPDHGATYEKVEELVKAFKRHNPNREITPDTDAFIYTYKFTPVKEKEEKPKKKPMAKKAKPKPKAKSKSKSKTKLKVKK